MQLTNGSHGDMVLPEDIVLPLKDRLMLEELEHRLAGNEELQEKLVMFLAAKGGKSVKDSVRRMFACLFSNDLSRFCNWTGLGHKISFRQLALKSIVHIAIRKNPSTKEATESQHF
ncbi:hypothetical protein J4Q44_G00371730 [Coregonus suidteri]|uniref:DUF4806 domain-containing protein n=1 Tax=Coregonus suidteri TaxID=861788 RepID=A0AAN8KN29_9TELE